MSARTPLPLRRDRLTRARVEAGLTPSALAEKVGCSKQSIWYYETGERVPRADRLAKIAEVLNRPISYFLPDEETPNA